MAEISKDLVRTYAPLYCDMVDWSTLVSNIRMDRKQSLLMLSFKEVAANYKKYVRKVTPNNQLKRQGKPMKRKGS